MKLPGVPPALWSALREAAGTERIALVGGAVRDWMLHHQHLDPWRGLVDLDLVIEAPEQGGGSRSRASSGSRGWVDTLSPGRPSPAWRLVERLSARTAGVTVRAAQPHGQYGTVELELDVDVPSAEGGGSAPIRLLLDVASARGESYPVPAANPVVTFGALNDDLARRDLTINAMAIDLATGTLLDPHGGAADLERRLLRFLHPQSLRDDPTRLVRAARYAARLGFALAPDSLDQAVDTLAAWPWPWRAGDPPVRAPAALGTRLRRELELLLEQEDWRLALARLQDWGGLRLLDPTLQEDHQWPLRLHWAERLRLPPLVALLAAAEHPLPLAERLQLPHRHHKLLAQFLTLRRMLRREPEDGAPPGADAGGPDTAWAWCQRLEAPSLSPSAVALALACGLGPRRPLLRWLLRWRHLGPATSSQDLIAAGVSPGPVLGAALRRSRQERVERERF